jgi:hypothetical protein
VSLLRKKRVVLASISSPAQGHREDLARTRREGPAVGEEAAGARAAGRPEAAFRDTWIEYDEGYDPSLEEWEVDRQFEEGPSGE